MGGDDGAVLSNVYAHSFIVEQASSRPDLILCNYLPLSPLSVRYAPHRGLKDMKHSMTGEDGIRIRNPVAGPGAFWVKILR